MKRTMSVYCCVMVLCSLLLTSCATTTRLTAVWKNEDYRGGPVKKVAILGISQRPAVRKFFEDEFARELKNRGGVDAVPTYTVLPNDQTADREAAVSKIRETGADAVLATRLIGRKVAETDVPSQVHSVPNYYDNFTGYYGYVYSTFGYQYLDEYAYMETNLYDTRTDQLIWTARSETWMVERDHQLIKTFIKVMIDKLSADKAIQ